MRDIKYNVNIIWEPAILGVTLSSSYNKLHIRIVKALYKSLSINVYGTAKFKTSLEGKNGSKTVINFHFFEYLYKVNYQYLMIKII